MIYALIQPKRNIGFKDGVVYNLSNNEIVNIKDIVEAKDLETLKLLEVSKENYLSSYCYHDLEDFCDGNEETKEYIPVLISIIDYMLKKVDGAFNPYNVFNEFMSEPEYYSELYEESQLKFVFEMLKVL